LKILTLINNKYMRKGQKKIKIEQFEIQKKELEKIIPNNENLPSTSKSEEVINILQNKIEELEKKDIENQKKLKMLYDVADKGRVFNYENTNVEKKPFKVKLSMFQGGIIIGWKTLRDELIKNFITGLTVGESQEYELLLDKEGQIETIKVSGYVAFSNARYNERIEAEVIGRKEDYNGKLEFEIKLPNGRQILMDAKFVN